MSKRKAYQTLEARDIHNIERHGPFLCSRADAWLGTGYYFWESFIENAHFWGVSGARYEQYVICESTFELDDSKCFNLVDNPNHLVDFNNVKNILIEHGLYEKEKTTVARIIEYIKNRKIFLFEAIRSYPTNTVSNKSEFSNRTFFQENRYDKYLDSTPAIQICFLEKNSLSRKGFKIVFPEEYVEEYLV
jgi:hypothetical protein